MPSRPFPSPGRAAVPLGLAAAFLALCAAHWRFTMDDAFISFRYAENLAHGHGIVWNVGEDPVEGFTSFLWVVLNAVAIRLGFSPALFSKALGVAAALGILGLLASAARRTDATIAFVAIGAIALSPPFALLAVQGMETTTAGLLLLGVARSTLRVLDRPDRSAIVPWYAFAFAAGLCRPDSLLFSAGVFAGVVGVLAARRNGVALRTFALAGGGFGTLGGIYLAWRVAYFGHLFPNPFYIKGTDESGLVQETGARYLGGFALDVALPYLVVLAALVALRFDRARIGPTLPLLLGSTTFLAYLATIDPIQGYAWRFVFPVVPVLALVALEWLGGLAVPRGVAGRAVAIVVAIALAGWTLRSFPETRAMTERDHRRLERVGASLAGLDGTMFVTAAGALPYASRWRSVDKLGLNSEEIAHHGLTRRLLDDLSPDLVMVRSARNGMYAPRGRLHDRDTLLLVNEYLVEAGFVAVTAVETGIGPNYLYFARPDSPLFEQIVERIRSIDGLPYVSVGGLLRERRIPVHDG